MTTFAYHRHFEAVQAADLAYVRNKDVQYNASWKQRGGPGAFFTIARPWDRFESISRTGGNRASPYDIFALLAFEGLQGPDGSLIACIRDLRRYLLLLECEAMEQAAPKEPIEDGGPSPYIWNDPLATSRTTPKFEVPEKPFNPDPYSGGSVPAASEAIISSDGDLANYGVGEGARMQPPAPPSRNPLVNGKPELLDRPCWDLQDGVSFNDIAAADPGFYHRSTRKTPVTYIVNRGHMFFTAHPETIAHLPRLDLELNAKELALLAPHYRPLYRYVESETKYRLDTPFQNPMWMK